MTRPVIAALAVICAALGYLLIARRTEPASLPAIAVTRESVPAAGPEAARVLMQLEDLRAIVTRLDKQPAAPNTKTGLLDKADRLKEQDPPVPEALDVEAVRAADAERYRAHMAQVAQVFAAEQVDGAWARLAGSRIDTELSQDVSLHALARSVDCRAQTCRVELEDDRSGQVSRRLPFIAIELADMFPTVSAERTDHGDGRGTMVLYLSTQTR